MGNVYEIIGKVQSSRELACSRCGTDVLSPVNLSFSEIIVVEKTRPRKSSTTHVSRSEDQAGPFCNYLTSENFDLAAFIHEQIAANEPYQIQCGRPECDEFVKLHQEKIATTESASEDDSPFAILKHLKPN
jgi:uncharacterized metal-binding protein YceD (DUF177 family)